ncbi:hypothetical protein M5689_008792 [Euphorbia peplus]|nr:hypothetical protein M5689_008792 [Euphorbia peplus]
MAVKWVYLAFFVSLTLGLGSARVNPVSDFGEIKENADDINFPNQHEVQVGGDAEPDPDTKSSKHLSDPDLDSIVFESSNAGDIDANINSVPIRKLDHLAPSKSSLAGNLFVIDSDGRLNGKEGLYDSLVINQLALAIQQLTKAIDDGRSKSSSLSPAENEDP